jgi:hypothetical protein
VGTLADCIAWTLALLWEQEMQHLLYELNAAGCFISAVSLSVHCGMYVGCCGLQVGAAIHVYGHSHINTDVVLSNPEGHIDHLLGARHGGGQRRYVQYALDAAGAHSAGLYCLWDGCRVAEPGCIAPLSG